MRVVDLEAVDRGTIGKSGIGCADLGLPGKQRRRTAPAQRNGRVGGDTPPWLGRAIKSAADRIQYATLEMHQDVRRHRSKREPRDPLTQSRSDVGTGRLRPHRVSYRTTSVNSVCDSSARIFTLTPRPGSVGGDTCPSFTTKSVSGTSGSGPITPRPNMNSPPGMTCAAARLA